MKLTRFKRRGYVQKPTPVCFLPGLSRALGGEVNIYIKRDDFLPGCAGGNKTRKLDFVMADVLEKKADCVITCGGVQSNHCRLTLSWAVHEGLDCYLVLEERVKNSYDPRATGNNLLYHLMGVKGIKVIPGDASSPEAMQALAEELIREGRRPYIIPGGASNPMGTLGYMNCAQEITQQMFQMDTDIQYVVVPSGSAGTQAGLLTGFYVDQTDIEVIGCDVSRPADAQTEKVRKLASDTLHYIGINEEFPSERVHCFDKFFYPGYSLPNAGMVEAVSLVARTESILLDPVYSGKAMAGLIDLLSTGYFPKGSNVLFIHTGGVPALYKYSSAFFESFGGNGKTSF